MPRYFFNVHHHSQGRDTEGEELPDDAAAWREATIITGELFKGIDGGFQPGQQWQLEVTDARRNPIYILRIIAEEM